MATRKSDQDEQSEQSEQSEQHKQGDQAKEQGAKQRSGQAKGGRGYSDPHLVGDMQEQVEARRRRREEATTVDGSESFNEPTDVNPEAESPNRPAPDDKSSSGSSTGSSDDSKS